MRLHRALLTASVLGLGLALGGCESFDLENIWNSKKPLPGERKALFPQGVPGVPQGVPADLVQGYQPPAEPEPQAAPPEPPKPKPRPRRVATPAQPPAQPRQMQAPAQQPTQPTQAAPWPAPQQAQPAASPWPDPPRPGTFQR